MAVLFLLYFVLAWISPDSLGFGDVKLAGLIGLVLGWLGIFQTVVGLFAGFLVGGLIALVLLLGRRVGMRSHIAFGPSMLAGALLALALEFR
jgi:leader peptidase (prepilin peptidase)/N-methyltransferase